MGMDCRVCVTTEDLWFRMAGGGGGHCGVQMGGGFSHESEHDLAIMVSDFWENGSGGTESRHSSDSDSGLCCDLVRLADNIQYYNLSMDKYESDLLLLVNSLMLSMRDTDLHLVKSGPCNASCIRFCLVKLLRHSGYDAAVCTSRWQGSGKVPGGDHEYIDVLNHKANGSSERLVIDIDFRSHFEIARAVEPYDRILSSLPVVYVGSLTKLEKFLQVMADASRSSLRQNSMPLPPWRSLAYLQAKWHSPYIRQFSPGDQISTLPSEHKQCSGHLKRMQTLLQSEIEVEQLLKPKNSENNRRPKFERWRCPSTWNL